MDELARIAEFCRARTKDYFRFDPFLHYRLDGDPARNADIEAERLTPDEIAALERGDAERFGAMEKHRDDFVMTDLGDEGCVHLFRCGAGKRNFVVGHDGRFKICQSLMHPDFLYDLRRGSLRDAWTGFGASRPGALVPAGRVPGTLRPVPDRQSVPVVPGQRPPRVRGARRSGGLFLPRGPRPGRHPGRN